LINNLLGRIPQIENNILDTVDRIGEIDEFFRGQAELWMQKHGIIKKGESRLPILALKKTKGYPSLIEYWLKPAGFSHAQSKAVMELVNAANGKYIASETHRVVRDRGWLVLLEKQVEQADIYILDNDCKILKYNGEKLEIVVKKQSELEKSPLVAQLNYSTLEFPLILRRWKEGDYFYPLGMSKKKKLSRFLIDIKLTPLEKESVWVLESNKRICWVVGYRIDNRFKVDLNTDNVFKINKI
jgi:tRNA(Ile)-lysidine synthase